MPPSRNCKFFYMFLTLACIACGSLPSTGPGMILHFGNGKDGKAILFEEAITAEGKMFSHPGALSPESEPFRGGKVMGAAPDGRSLPEWVEFTWVEADYPRTRSRSPEEWKAMPKNVGRVYVRNKIPTDVVDNIVRSKRQPVKVGDPELRLWIYLVWVDSGIKLRWEEVSGCCTTLRSGGNPVEN